MRKNFKYMIIHRLIIACITLFIAIIFAIINFSYPTIVRAEIDRYTTVSEDFADIGLDMSKYPFVPDDRSLSVIQIAESNNNELFVYVYQPQTLRYETLKMQMALSAGLEAVFAEYDLRVIDRKDTVLKYVVDNLYVDLNKENTYNISSISRQSDPNWGEYETTYTAYPVAQEWTATTINGKRTYIMDGIDVVIVTDYYSSSIRYVNKSFFYSDAADSFYVAFSSDHEMDQLLEVDVAFDYFPYFCKLDSDYSLKEDTYIEYRTRTVSDISHLTYDGETEIKLNGITKRKYTWKWIQSAKDFVSTESLSNEAKNAISKQEWVLRYFGSDLRISPNGGGLVRPWGYDVMGNAPDNVTFLRMKFKFRGVVYNLGVVMDHIKVDKPGTGDITVTTPILAGDSNKIPWWVWLILAAVLIILLIIFAPRLILNLLSYLWLGVKVIVNVLISPFKWIIQKIRGDSGD